VILWPWSQCVVNLIEIEQSSAELFVICQIFAPVTWRCDFERHVSTLCVKCEPNRTICGRVIRNLTHFRRRIFHRDPTAEMRGSNCTKVVYTQGYHCRLPVCFRIQMRHHAAFSNAVRSKSSDVENDAKFRAFWPAAVLIICTIRKMCQLELIFPSMQHYTYEGWLVLNWIVNTSSSCCKGTSGLLDIMVSNTLIFAVLKARLMSPLHCVLNWEVFLHW